MQGRLKKMNFIQKYNLKKRLNQFIELKKRGEIHVCSLEQARCICVVYTFESAELLEQLVKTIHSLRKEKDSVSLYCHIPKGKAVLTNNEDEICFISEKDFNFIGLLCKEKFLSLQKQSFDILINLNKNNSLFSLYLAGKIKAKFRVGRCEDAKDYCDVIIYSSDENYTFEDYFRSVCEYTKKITC